MKFQAGKKFSVKNPEQPRQEDDSNDFPKQICIVKKKTIARSFKGRWRDQIQLPAVGSFYVESHLASSYDRFSGGRAFPSNTREGVLAHLQRSAQLLGLGVDQLYPSEWSRRWTPPEGGRAGQGARGPHKPSPLEEMFLFNMMFDASSLPPAGEKWLISFGEKFVIVVGGFEVGPGDRNRLGGIQPEVQYFLEAPNAAELTLHGPLRSIVLNEESQYLEPGPVECDALEYQ